MKSIQQRSSGGVVYRGAGKEVEIVLIYLKSRNVWSLPKGAIERGESQGETALREVEEETGLRAKIVQRIGGISYTFFIKDRDSRCFKNVDYYLMEFIEGSTDDHDSEVDEVGWFPIDEALEKVIYKGDREIIKKAREILLSQ